MSVETQLGVDHIIQAESRNTQRYQLAHSYSGIILLETGFTGMPVQKMSHLASMNTWLANLSNKKSKNNLFWGSQRNIKAGKKVNHRLFILLVFNILFNMRKLSKIAYNYTHPSIEA